MKITERMLLDNYDYLCRGGAKTSVINGERIYWEYRDEDALGNRGCVTSGPRAVYITLEWDRDGVIRLLGDCADHPSRAKIAHDEAVLWGDEVAD